ncbi:DUF2752 domain-containing protein [Mucilaginibacter sp. UR6-1]|uniref:DUF2752 domain-containing protein n=1 Tax=Mucilaginibacter sp. UR6-1 TaxID=1435643 RepID=UPI001E397E81|nr:DUF2752 domain-containing protein [Mucilaginibacter sp. UR6-1]MCC8408438.1 DUF2752 domain-containing protein [Mucilaginibacter sp. UR6-1]
MALYVIARPFSEQLFNWLKGHLLPCPFKYLTNLDCPGCGFQRSFIALLQGDFKSSFELYPPSIPLILAFLYFAASHKFPLDNRNDTVKKTVFIVAATIVTVSYIIKLWHLHTGGYKASA